MVAPLEMCTFLSDRSSFDEQFSSGVRRTDPGARLPGLDVSQIYPPCGPGPLYSVSLCLDFLISETEMINGTYLPEPWWGLTELIHATH